MTTSEAGNGPSDRPAPPGLTPRAAEFWARVWAEFELTEAEAEMLVEAVQTIAEIDSLKDALDGDGVTVEGSRGQRRVHPAVNEIRQHRMALARILKQLDLADDVPETEATKAARSAAQARWNASRARDAKKVG